MNQAQLHAGFNRFVKSGAIGGVIGGVAASIPVLSILNSCFCLLIGVGSVIGVNMYLKEHPGEQLADGDGAAIGAIAGAIGGVLSSILGWVLGFALASVLASIYSSLPFTGISAGGYLGTGIVGLVIGIPVNAILCGGFGALYGFLSLQLFFKDRRRAK
jgi:hypothetical protein